LHSILIYKKVGAHLNNFIHDMLWKLAKALDHLPFCSYLHKHVCTLKHMCTVKSSQHDIVAHPSGHFEVCSFSTLILFEYMNYINMQRRILKEYMLINSLHGWKMLSQPCAPYVLAICMFLIYSCALCNAGFEWTYSIP
jgi:hypothetical protein